MAWDEKVWAFNIGDFTGLAGGAAQQEVLDTINNRVNQYRLALDTTAAAKTTKELGDLDLISELPVDTILPMAAIHLLTQFASGVSLDGDYL